MTVVAKLGSSIVADSAGDVRADVLDRVCGQVAELHAGGEDVVMVTSGAIALGMRLMGFDARPRAVDELQAASAVGQGSLFRAYEERLAAHDVHAAQVLLNSSDVSTRVNYLNARATLRRLLEWRAVPVINENDTTATDEITFGDNDFLAAQVALLLGARHARAPHRHRRAAYGRPAPRPRCAADRAGRRLRRALVGYEIGDRTSPFGSGGMRSKVAAAEMATAAGIEVVVCDGTQRRHAARGRRGRAGRDAVSCRTPSAHPASSSGFATRSRAGARSPIDAGAARVLREQGSSLLPVGIAAVEGDFEAGDAIEVVSDGERGRQGDRELLRGRAWADQGHEVERRAGRMPHAAEEADAPGLLRPGVAGRERVGRSPRS